MQTAHEPTDAEIQEHLDKMSHDHAVQTTTLEYIIEWLFKDQDKLPDGTTKEQVSRLTRFKQIELLERICDDQLPIGNTQVPFGEICRFVREVDKHGFRTTDDF